MTFRDNEIALPGDREVIERELTRSVAQVLHLVPGRTAGHRGLQEVGVDIILSATFVRARSGPPATLAATVADACSAAVPPRATTPGGVAEDIADDYARAKAEVKAILRRHEPVTR